MMTLIFVVLLVAVFWKVLKIAVKAAWGLSKMVCTVVLLPLVLLGLVFKGLIAIAFPILLIVGVIAVFSKEF